MLKLIWFIVSILLIIIIFLRVPQQNVGLSSFVLGSSSPKSVARFLNILTGFGILIYFGIALTFNLRS